MAVISEDIVRELAGVKGNGAPVTTCYLDVDGRRHRAKSGYEQALTRLMREVRPARDDVGLQRDLDRIERFVRSGIDRSRTRGLAIFACSGADLWRVVNLPVPVRDQLIVNDSPAVGQLRAALETFGRFGVLLLSRQRARVLVFEVDQVVDKEELSSESTRDIDVRGEKERGEVQGKAEALEHAHLRRAVDLTFDVWQRCGFDHLAVAAPDDLLRSVEHSLHPYLRERLTGRLPLTPGCSLEDVRQAVRDAEVRAERAHEAALVERLRAAVGAGGRGVAGLDDTLAALSDRRVETLLVSDGYREEGWRCPSTGRLAQRGPKNPVSGEPMERVADVVEEAVQEAFALGCSVEVCENADLDVLGRIGALLRF